MSSISRKKRRIQNKIFVSIFTVKNQKVMFEFLIKLLFVFGYFRFLTSQPLDISDESKISKSEVISVEEKSSITECILQCMIHSQQCCAVGFLGYQFNNHTTDRSLISCHFLRKEFIYNINECASKDSIKLKITVSKRLTFVKLCYYNK